MPVTTDQKNRLGPALPILRAVDVMKKFDRFPGSLDAQSAIIQELQLQIADLNTRHELIQDALTEKENEVDSLHVIIKDLNSELEKSKLCSR